MSSESSDLMDATVEVSGSSWSGTSSLALTSKNPWTFDQVEGVSSSSSFTSFVSSGVSDFFSSSSEPKIKPSNELPSVDSSLAGSVSGTVSSTAGSGSSVSSVSATMGTSSVSVISSESSSFSSISELSCSARSSSIFSSFASIS